VSKVIGGLNNLRSQRSLWERKKIMIEHLEQHPDDHNGVNVHPTLNAERDVHKRHSRAPWWHTDVVAMLPISVEAKTPDILLIFLCMSQRTSRTEVIETPYYF
jgi:hypothetical protein